MRWETTTALLLLGQVACATALEPPAHTAQGALVAPWPERLVLPDGAVVRWSTSGEVVALLPGDADDAQAAIEQALTASGWVFVPAAQAPREDDERDRVGRWERDGAHLSVALRTDGDNGVISIAVLP